MIVIPIVTGLIGVGQAYLNNVVGQNVMQDLRNALYAHLQRMPLRFFTETRTGEIQSRLANDVGGVQAVVTDTAANLTSNLAVAISTIVAMFLIDWQLTAAVARHDAVLPVPDLPGRQGPPDGQHRDPEVAGRPVGGTEETLSVSGMLLSKTFGQQETVDRPLPRPQPAAGRAPDPPGDGRSLVLHDHRHDLQHHPGVRVLAGRRRSPQNGDPTAPSAGAIVAFTTLQSRLFFPLGAAAQRPGRDPGLARAVRPDLRVPRPGARDRRRARRGRPRPGDGPGRVRFRDVSFRYPRAAGRRRGATAPTDEAVADGRAALDGPEAGVEDGRSRPEPPRWPAVEAADEWAARRDGARRDRRRTGRRPAGRPARRGFALEGIDFEAAAGRARRAGRAVRLGQDDDDLPDPAPVRRRRGRGRDRRPRLRTVTLESLGRVDRLRDPGDVPVPLLDPRQPALRQARRDRRRARGRGPGGGDPRPDHRAARRLRHDRRRARLQALGRREAADRDRPGPAQGPPDPHPRRGHLGPRHRQRAAHPGRARAAHGGPDDDRHRPPPVDDPAGRPDPRLRARPDRRARAPTPSCSPRAACTRGLYREQFLSAHRQAPSRPWSCARRR